MTTYAKDFSDELTTGVFASDFTARYATMTNWTIEAPTDAEDDRVFRSTGDSGLQLASWDDVDGDANRANSDIVMRFKKDGDAAQEFYVWTRASGSSGSETGYCLYVTTGGIMTVLRYNSGSPTTVIDTNQDLNTDGVANPWTQFSDDADPSFTYDIPNLWVYVRFRVQGTGATVTIEARCWIDGVQITNEPDFWLVWDDDTSASRITSAGWIGVGRAAHTNQLDIDYFAVGTNGDTAPINASTNTTVRISTVFVEAIGQEANPEVQMTQQFVNVLGQYAAPEVRLSSMYAQVLHERNVDVGNDVSGQLIITSG